MNQQTNYLQYITVVAGIVIVGAFIYWYGTSAYQFFYEITPLNQATSTVTIPAAELAQLQTEARKYRSIAAMVEESATSSFIVEPTNRPSVAASVIGRPPQSPYDTLVIGIGGVDGVMKGAGVWWPPGVYLGQVKDVNQRTAVVELITSPGVKHSSLINGLSVTTEGRGGDQLYVEIPDNEVISVGTPVISDVYELPVGVVAVTEELPTTNLQAVYITRFVSSQAIEHVYVEKQ